MPITTKTFSLNSTHGEVYSTQQYVIEFVNDLWQVGGFLRVLLKVALNTITLTPNPSAIEAGDEFDIHPSM